MDVNFSSITDIYNKYLSDAASKETSSLSKLNGTKDYSKATDDELMDVCKQFEAYFLEQCFIFSQSFQLFRNGGRRDVLEAMRSHIALGLLVIGSDAVTHELMGQHTAHTFNAEGEAGVFEGGAMTQSHHAAHHFLNLLIA